MAKLVFPNFLLRNKRKTCLILCLHEIATTGLLKLQWLRTCAHHHGVKVSAKPGVMGLTLQPLGYSIHG